MSTALKKSGDSKPCPSLPFGFKGLLSHVYTHLLFAVPGRELTDRNWSCGFFCRVQFSPYPWQWFPVRWQSFCLSHTNHVWANLLVILLLCPSVTAATLFWKSLNKRLLRLVQSVFSIPGLHILRVSQSQLENAQKTNSTLCWTCIVYFYCLTL